MVETGFECPQIKFVPNSDSTQLLWVGKIMTRNWPEWSFGWPDWALLVLSEYWSILGLLQEGSKSCRILVEILSNLIRFGWIYQDLADIPPIWPRSSWICRDLVEISLYWRSLSFDLPNFWLKLTICDRERTSHRASQVCWFLKQPNYNSNQ